MQQYRVYVSIVGSPWRPPYEGYVDVAGDNAEDAASRALDKLQNTSFSDVPRSSMRIKKVERR